jgi:hypothetical protein
MAVPVIARLPRSVPARVSARQLSVYCYNPAATRVEILMRTSRLLPIVAAATALLLLPACSRVKDDWKAAQGADTSEAYQDFLQQHADSEFAVQAQARLKQLAEDRDWQQAYEQFVAQHADSKWAQEARVRIENFNLAAGGQAVTPAPADAAAGAPVAPGVSGAPAAGAAPPDAIATTPPAAAGKPVAAPKAAASGSHFVQLGAFSTRVRAEADWRSLQSKYASDLKGLKPRYAAGKSQGKPVVRLQVGLASAPRAEALCASLKRRGQACVAVH